MSTHAPNPHYRQHHDQDARRFSPPTDEWYWGDEFDDYSVVVFDPYDSTVERWLESTAFCPLFNWR